MAIKKGNIQDLDAAVEAVTDSERDPIFGGLEKTRRARNLTPGKRKKAEQDAARNRVMIDISPELEQVLDRVAERLSVPRSQVASYLMLMGLWAADMEEMRAACEASRSMRYEYNLARMPQIPEGWKNGDGKK